MRDLASEIDDIRAELDKKPDKSNRDIEGYLLGLLAMLKADLTKLEARVAALENK